MYCETCKHQLTMYFVYDDEIKIPHCWLDKYNPENDTSECGNYEKGEQ